MIRRHGTRVSGWHRINRCSSVGAILVHWGKASWKAQLHRMIRRCKKRSVGALTGGLLREHVKRVEAKPSAPDDSKEHRSNTSEQWRQQTVENPFSAGWSDAHWMNRRQAIDLSGASCVTCQKPQWLPQGTEWPDEPVPPRRSIRRHVESWVTAPNSSLHLVAYIYAIPRPFWSCWSCYKSQTHPRTFQAIQELSDHIFSS